MFKKKKLSESALEGIIYQIRYLIKEKNASNKALVYRLSRMLSDYGVPTESMITPNDWDKIC